MKTEEKYIPTTLGSIYTKIEHGDDRPPLVFLHGVFMDHTLWSNFDSSLTGRTHIYLDMPSHGNSQPVGRHWSLDECVEMLIEVLDALKIEQCIPIGHSWGSMTILRAAVQHPERFLSLGLFNMPFQETTGMSRLGFTLQKSMVYFPRFYGKQAAKALYTEDFLNDQPETIEYIQDGMHRRPPIETARTLDAVILLAKDARPIIHELAVPAIVVKGESDYVGEPPGLQIRLVPGGHVTPHEAPAETEQAILDTVALGEREFFR